jgi:hypothetical protein
MAKSRFLQRLEKYGKPIELKSDSNAETELSLKSIPKVSQEQIIIEEQASTNKYILPIAIGVGVISIIAIVYLLRKK